ncbi:heme lyase CcmF/NrfE family subunit [Alphaproteobacteria bacterium]|nr:heme lyase CcmF/NrfE family subunit [Alphaproteobacteria bacterium]
MIGEIGYIFLIFAFTLSFLQLFNGVKISFFNFSEENYKFLKSLTYFISFFLLSSFFSLIISYVISDFSILNVYNNSHTNKPLLYKISGTWGNHEGSLLMWLAMLGLYGLLFTKFSTEESTIFTSKALFAISIINIGFIGFTIFTSNPFERISPIPLEGNGLNPVLQDPGLAFHPPLLYLGYVGLTIPFAYSIAALLEEKIDNQWAKAIRPWILAPWIFLTLGISLGSFWAYYELGWGGWWFWDPVENISLLPWLLSTALLHSNRVTEKRNNLKSWTILLSIIAFSLTLLGTFIVRSGLLTSVHAFASDPARGIFILSFLFLVTFFSLILYALKYEKIENNKSFHLISKEGGLLLNNVFLCASAATILLGTLWPLFVEVTTGKDISVGSPYFKLVFLPLIIPAIYLSGISINLNWKFNEMQSILDKLGKFFIIFIFIIIGIAFLLEGPVMMILGLSLSVWLFLSIINDMLNKIKYQSVKNKYKIKKLFSIPISTYGMYVAHLGVAVFILGVAVSDTKNKYFEGILKVGESTEVASYQIKFLEVSKNTDKNWIAEKGLFAVKKKEKEFIMNAERRTYKDTGMPSTEAAIYRSYFNHLYIVMGQEQPANSGLRIVRVYYNPFIILIWMGAFIMALGGIISILDRKRGKKK